MSTSDQVTDAAESDITEMAGRVGLVTRGILYLISAALTVRIATLDYAAVGEEGPGKNGALRAAADQPFGRVLVGVLAVGLAGYALWRFAAAITYRGDADEPLATTWAKRAGYVGRGLIYVVGIITAVSLLLADNPERSSGSDDRTRRVFDLPAGRWIVGLVGIGFLVGAAYNGYRAATGKYKEKWSAALSDAQRRVATVVSVAGLVGHMVVFALIGWFLCKAAWEYDPTEPEGIDEAVKALADEPYGTTFLMILAAGMAAYGGFSFLEARWRDVLQE